MKALKNLFVLIIFLNFSDCFSQSDSDTIFKNNGKIIVCTITVTNATTIFYTANNSRIQEIALKEISRFIQKGKTTSSSDAQNLNSFLLSNNVVTVSDSVLLSNEMDYLKNCLRSHHRQFKTGGLTTIFGMGITFGGLIMGMKKPDNTSIGITAAGGLTTLIGGVIMFDSHKWLGRAGMGISGNGLTVRYIFK